MAVFVGGSSREAEGSQYLSASRLPVPNRPFRYEWAHGNLWSERSAEQLNRVEDHFLPYYAKVELRVWQLYGCRSEARGPFPLQVA